MLGYSCNIEKGKVYLKSHVLLITLVGTAANKRFFLNFDIVYYLLKFPHLMLA